MWLRETANPASVKPWDVGVWLREKAHPASVKPWVPCLAQKPGVVESKFKAILDYIAS